MLVQFTPWSLATDRMQYATWITIFAFAFDLVVRVGLCLRVVMRRMPVGTSLAWLTTIIIFPFGGGLLYLLLGEKHLGTRRARRAEVARGGPHWG